MSNIEWTDKSWQVTSGCTKVSDGCKHCYAETMANRLAGMCRADEAAGRNPGKKKSYPLVVRDNGLWNGTVVTLPDNLAEPLSWRKPRMVFVNSMSDLFHEAVPFEFIDRVFAVMALCPQHTFQVLTKRPERMAEYLASDHPRENALKAMAERIGRGYEEKVPPIRCCRPWGNVVLPWPLPNVWLGASAENQETADARIPHLLRCPAAVRFLSCEPLLGPVNIELALCTCPWSEDAMQTRHLLDCPADTRRPEDHRRWSDLHWLIVGGESGPQARPCNVEWIRSIVKQCARAGVPCFVKQLGARTCIQEKDRGDVITFERGCGFWPDNARGLAESWIVRMKDRKGGDTAEWTPELRVREFPR